MRLFIDYGAIHLKPMKKVFFLSHRKHKNMGRTFNPSSYLYLKMWLRGTACYIYSHLALYDRCLVCPHIDHSICFVHELLYNMYLYCSNGKCGFQYPIKCPSKCSLPSCLYTKVASSPK